MARMKNSSSYKVAIYNQTGSLMKQVSMTNKTISINTTEFPNGIYFIHLMDNTGGKDRFEEDINQPLILIKGRGENIIHLLPSLFFFRQSMQNV